MNRQRSGFGLYAAFMVIIVLAMFYITGKISAGSSPSQQKFETAVKDGKVTSAQIVQNKEVPTGSVVVQEQGGDSYTVNVTDVNAAISLLENADVTYTVQNVQRDSIFMTSVLPALLLGMILLFGMSMMNRSMGGGGGGGNKMMNFGKSNAHMSTDKDKKVLFRDVAGLKEEKEDLVEVVDFLKAPEKYTQVGARIPKGVLLVGPPGTVKPFWRKLLQERQACRSSAFPDRISWKCSSASALPVSATCLRKEKNMRRVSSSSMRSTPWQDEEAPAWAAATMRESRP